MADRGRGMYRLGRLAGAQYRKATWYWHSIAGNEAEAIQAEHGVGRDMAAEVLVETPPDPDRATQALIDELGAALAGVVRNRLHRFEMTAIAENRPTAFALPGGFIFVTRSLVDLCERNRDELAFIVSHEMAHVIRRHAINRLLTQQVISAASRVSPGRGVLGAWIRRVGWQWLERAYSQDEELEADELGLRLMHAAGFDPTAAIHALERLGALAPHADALDVGQYLSTHPPIPDRISRLRAVVASMTQP